MSNRLVQSSLAHPKLTYWLLLLITIAVGSLILNIKIDTDPENMLAENEPARLFHNQVKQDFLLDDLIVVGVVAKDSANIFNIQSLAELKQLSDEILLIKGVNSKEVNSLSTIDSISQTKTGAIRFEWMMNEPPINQQDVSRIANNALNLPFVVNSLVSGDQRAAAIYVPIFDKNESYRISEEIHLAISHLSGVNDYYITGLPVAEDTFGVEMFVQMGISAPLAALVIYLLMLYFFRSAALVAAPMIVAMATVIIIMGSMIGAGFTVHIMSSMIPIFLMPIAVVDSVHLMSEFADNYKPKDDARTVIVKVTESLFKPMLFTSVTSAAGFFSLAFTPIPPVQVFGVFVGSGILLAFVLTIIFVPVYVSRMNEQQLLKMQQKLHDGKNSKSLIAKVLPIWGTFSVARSHLIIALSIILLVFSIIGLFKIEINDNPVRWFKPTHQIRIADKVLNQHFAGTYDAHLVFSLTDKPQLIANWRSQVENIIASVDQQSDIALKVSEFFSKYDGEDPFQAFVLLLDDLSFSADASESNLIASLFELSEDISAQSRVFTDPKNLAYLSALQDYLVKQGHVGKSNSLVDLVKTVNRELHSGQPVDFVIPPTQAAVSQTLLQFQSSHRPQDLWHFVTPDYSRSLIWLQMTSGDNKDMAKVIKSVEQYVQQNPVPENLSMQWAGKAYINLVWQNKMVAGMFDSLASAFVIVFLMMVLLFRSLVYGLLAMLPLSITITFMYGLIGWLGKYYDMPIAVLSALTLGLSVDFAIHFIERTRSFFAQTNSWSETVKLMFQEPARAISRNALVIALGFTPLLFAPLVPYITVGVFLAVIMAVSALVTLFVLPASMDVLKGYLFKQNKS